MAEIKHNTPMIKGGGTNNPPIGKSGNTNSSNSGQRNFSHLPSSYSNAGVKSSGASKASPAKSGKGPQFSHLPSSPAAVKTK